MWFYVGFIIGAGAGCLLSTVFIFPDNLLNIKLAEMTIGYLLQIFGGLIVICFLGVIGSRVCNWISEKWECANIGSTTRDQRIEMYGEMGSDRYNEHIARAFAIAKAQRKE